ncbi:MAG: fructose-1,6-bisphosphatase [Lachnospiraceae bacterium]|nr:fructose-1,6-bisphosphatase [Lachnospiraceae bacterium]
MEEKYLKLLANEYPDQESVRIAIVKLTAQTRLPKGTEYFFSDLHGEQEGFSYLLRSGSGIIKEKIKILFQGTLSEAHQNQLANLIYTPEHVISLLKDHDYDSSLWMKQMIPHLVLLCREISSKYSKMRVRSKMPSEYRHLMEELLYPGQEEGKKEYAQDVIEAIVEQGLGDTFIPVICRLIQGLTVDRIHVIGDIFDRGPRPDQIMEELIAFGDVDIQWGNHDISWMGAACGNPVLIANVVRMGISYNNFDCLEDGYGINLRPLSSFAQKTYGNDPCTQFIPKVLDENRYDQVDLGLAARMHKAIAVIQFKLAGQLIKRRPDFGIGDRSHLEKIDYERGVLLEGGLEYPLLDTHFPTVDPQDPLRLTREEEELMTALTASFAHSEVLHRHVQFLYSHGSMYKSVNGNLLFHGCVPMKEDGSFQTMGVCGTEYSGKALLDRFGEVARDAYFLSSDAQKKARSVDWMWYLWSGPCSPLFGKSKLSAFEHYFVADKTLQKEVMDPYYRLSERKETCETILREFGMDVEHCHIINGHVPVKIKDGEKPVKAEGKLYVIDGGISKAYQSKTGIAGYTMIFNSHYMALAEHHNFITEKDRAKEKLNLQITEQMPRRLLVKDTDAGAVLLEQIEDLKALLAAYREGRIREKRR